MGFEGERDSREGMAREPEWHWQKSMVLRVFERITGLIYLDLAGFGRAGDTILILARVPGTQKTDGPESRRLCSSLFLPEADGAKALTPAGRFLIPRRSAEAWTFKRPVKRGWVPKRS